MTGEGTSAFHHPRKIMRRVIPENMRTTMTMPLIMGLRTLMMDGTSVGRRGMKRHMMQYMWMQIIPRNTLRRPPDPRTLTYQQRVV